MVASPLTMKLELVILPVADVDRARDFYRDSLGFSVDVDVVPVPGVRVVQLTPPGSACSIGMGVGLPVYTAMQVGSVTGLHLVVEDLEAVRAELLGRGVDVAPVIDAGGGVRFAPFTDPDGNGWLLQEMAWRRGEAF